VTDRRLGAGLLFVGLALTVASLVALVLPGGGGPSAAALTTPSIAATTSASLAPTGGPSVAFATPTVKPGATSTSSAAPAPSAEPTVDPVDVAVRRFFGDLVQAFHAGDATFQVAHLHPATLARYGREQCLTELPKRADPTVAITIRSIGSAESWAYKTDDLTTPIDAAIPVEADVIVQGGAAAAQTIHVVVGPDGSILWLTDCGTPLP
jgi:hypothetical protein